MREDDIQHGEDKRAENPGGWFGKVMGCAGYSSAVEDQAPPRNAKLMRFALFLLPTLLVALSSYLYLHLQAAPFTPPVGYVFPREPVLKGVYQYESPGNKIHQSFVGDTRVWCSSFSYYAGTWAQTGSYFDCGRTEQLLGRVVEVHRVRVPRRNNGVGPLVVKIVSGEHVYLDRSDAEIRELWIRSTLSSTSTGAMLLTIICGCVFWPLSSYVMKRFILRRKK